MLMEKPRKVQYWILGFVLMVCLLNYCYVDMQMIVRHSLNIWNCLFSGNIFHFYQTATQLPIGNMNALHGEVPYDIWVYIPIAVWNFPVFLWEKITGLTFESNLVALIWIRLGNMVPYVASIWAVWKLTESLDENFVQRSWICYFYSSSIFLLNGLFCLGQIDIYNTFFMLLGINAYLKKDRKKFLALFAISITYKMFSLFVFLPLLVMREKRILYMMRDTMLALSLSLTSKILFFADKMKTPTQFDERRFIRLLFERRLSLTGISISLLVILFGALLLWCWNSEIEEKNLNYWTIWVAFAGYACFFVGATTLPYWAVVFSPFIPLLIMNFPHKAKLLLWMETAAGAAYFIMGLCEYGYAYAAPANTRWMLAGVLNGRAIKGLDFSVLYQQLSTGAKGNLESLLWGIFIVVIVAITVMTWPGNIKPEIREKQLIADDGSVWSRIAANVCFVLMPLVIYLLF